MAGMEKLVFTLAEVAEMTGWSELSIQRDLRGGKYKHIYRSKKYGMTRAQVEAMVAAHERGEDAAAPEDNDLEAARQATAASLTRRGAA